ncbi:MAG: LiaF domain-containing protein [Bacteroidota bacterium]
MAKVINRSISFGILLVVAGIVFLLGNLDILPYEVTDFLFNWKGLLLLIGFSVFFSDENRLPGIILIAFSTLLLTGDYLEEYLDIDFLSWDVLWPTFIIVGGLLVIAQRAQLGIFRAKTEPVSYGATDDYLNVTAVLGGGDIHVNSADFRGGKVTAFMGGGTYDLSQAEIVEGPVVIDVFAMFGGATFIVPSDWNVRMEITPIMGGFSDDRKRLKTMQEGSSHKELILRGTVIMGGGEVKNYA